MDIAEACKTLRKCSDAMRTYAVPAECDDVPLAVVTLKRYLEQARGDGRPIDELLISESLLLTPQGIRWVMRFVADAEFVESARSGARG
jgi:hypothetical protein